MDTEKEGAKEAIAHPSQLPERMQREIAEYSIKLRQQGRSRRHITRAIIHKFKLNAR